MKRKSQNTPSSRFRVPPDVSHMSSSSLSPSPSSSHHSSEIWEPLVTPSKRPKQHLLQSHEDDASQSISARTRARTKPSALSDSPAQPSQPFHPPQPPQSPPKRGRGRPKRKTMSLNTEEPPPGFGVNPMQPPASQPQIPTDASLVPLPASQAQQSQIPPSTTALQLQCRDPRSALFKSRPSPSGSGSIPSDSRHSHRHSEPPPKQSERSSREPEASPRKRDADRKQEHPTRGEKAQKTSFRLVPSISQLPSASEGTPLSHANRAGAGQPRGGAAFFQPDTALGSAQLHRGSGAFSPGGGLVTVQPSGGRAAQASGRVETAQPTEGLANVQSPRMFSVTQPGRRFAAAQPERRSENAQPGGRFGAAQHGRGAEAFQSHPGFEAFASPSEGLLYLQYGAGLGIPPPRPPPGSPPPPVPGAPLSGAGTGGSPSHRANTAKETPSGRISGDNRVSGIAENLLTRTQSGAGPIPGLKPFQPAGGRSQAVPDTNRPVARFPPATGEVSTSRPATGTASPSPNTTPRAATSQPATGGASPPWRTSRRAATPQNPPGGTAPSQPASEGASPSQTVARAVANPQQTTGAAAKSQAVTGASLTNAEKAGIIEGYLSKMDKFLESAMPTPEALQQCRCLRQAVKGVRECRARLERKHEQNLEREARRIEKELAIDAVKKREQAADDEAKDAYRKAEEARARREAAAAEAIRLEREHNAIGDSSSREGTPEAGPPRPQPTEAQ